MAELQNAKWELFARYIAQGKTMADAHELAGFARSSSSASAMKKIPEVSARITELIAERTAALDRMDPGKLKPHTPELVRKGELDITKEWVMAELVENIELARGAGQLAAANKALELLGTELGMFGKSKSGPEEGKSAPTPTIPISELTRVLDLLQGTLPAGSLITAEQITPHITGSPPRGRPRTTHIGEGTNPVEWRARRDKKLKEAEENAETTGPRESKTQRSDNSTS